MGLRDRIANFIGAKLDIMHQVRGLRVMVDNTRPDIATADVIARLDEALALIQRHQPWRLAHLQRDLDHINVARFPCRGAYFPEYRACMVELTFLNRRDIGPAVVAATIVHEGMHARIHRRSALGAGPSAQDSGVRDKSREERICRRAELEFGQSLPADIGAPVVQRAVESLAMADEEVAPEIDWRVAEQRMADVDRQAN
ncbi:MAG: hypothetical protein AABZ80_10290 [Gemmatimonadota bacterium]